MSYLEPCWAILSDLGGHLGLSEALLEQSWTILGDRTPRDRPRPVPGEGVGGCVNPSQKGQKGVGKGNSLNHSRPKGLVGFAFILSLGAVTAKLSFFPLQACSW